MSEVDYTRVTYEIPLNFAGMLAQHNSQLIFGHVSGGHTDSSEQGRVMWARVKGKAENALMRLPFRKVYNFRPGFMRPLATQHNVKTMYKVLGGMYPVLHAVFPRNVITMQEVGLAMINSVLKGYNKSILEVPDIRALAGVSTV
jgi:hypothetical protein